MRIVLELSLIGPGLFWKEVRWPLCPREGETVEVFESLVTRVQHVTWDLVMEPTVRVDLGTHPLHPELVEALHEDGWTG